MRPVPIPDELVTEDVRRIVISPPGGDLTDEHVGAVESLVGIVPHGTGRAVCMTMMIALEDGELERLAEMERPALWLSLYTPQIPVFAVEVADGRG